LKKLRYEINQGVKTPGQITGRNRKGSNRVNRGGSWNNNADNCRVANRNNNEPENRNNNLGFRLVLVPQLTRKGWMSIQVNRLQSRPAQAGE
jgi:hypothetical protein